VERRSDGGSYGITLGTQAHLVSGEPQVAAQDGQWDGSFFPLAPKTEGRVMILKGAGNAICLGTAAAFITAAMEATP